VRERNRCAPDAGRPAGGHLVAERCSLKGKELGRSSSPPAARAETGASQARMSNAETQR